MADQVSTLRQTAQVMRMPPADTPKAVKALRERIEELEEENRRLLSIITSDATGPKLRLSKTERALFNLMERGTWMATQTAHDAIQVVNGSVSDPKIVGVIIHRLRTKLKGKYVIRSQWGYGYKMVRAG